jgi:spore coat protein A, manganese oxidase
MNPGEVTTIRIRFAPNDGASTYPFDPTQGPGYVWHCHIVDHEDNDMMRPYKLQP